MGVRVRGHVHTEKVIMTTVRDKAGDWNSIRYVSHRVLSTIEDWMIEYLLLNAND